LTKIRWESTLLPLIPFSFYLSNAIDSTAIDSNTIVRPKTSMHHLPCLILIRHAQSENNALPDHLRVSDPNITDLGVAQAKKLATAVRALKPTTLYCSAFLRSLETTRPVAEFTGLTPLIRQDIFEQGGCHRGYLPNTRIAEPGMNRETLAKRYANWQLDDRIDASGWFDLDHYETREEASLRAHRVVNWLEKESQTHSQNDRVAMVIHADFKVRLIEALLDDPNIESKLGEVVNTSITRLSKVSGRWRLDYWNVFTHLDSDEISA